MYPTSKQDDMSISGLTTSYIPASLDGLNVIDADQIYIDGQLVNLTDYVPYQGANRTIDAGGQNIQTTHTATATNDVVNKGLLDTTISNLAISIAGSFLDKVTLTPQTVIGNVSYTAQLSADDLLVPATKKATLGSVLSIDANYSTAATDAGVITRQYFGSISSSMGIYEATSTQNFAILQCADLGTGTGKRMDITWNLNINETYNSSIQLFASSDGVTTNQYLGPSVSFTPSDPLYKVMTGTFVPQYRYLCVLCATSKPSGVQTVRWYGLDIDEQGIELTNVTMPSLTADRVAVLNGNKQLVSSGISTTKLDYLDNVSSDIQTQLNGKLNLSGSNANQNIVLGTYKVQSTATPIVDDDLTRKGYVDSGLALKASLAANQTFTGTNTFSSLLPIVLSGLTPSRVLQLSASAVVQASAVTTTELGYVSGVTSGIQGQLNTLSGTFANYLPLTGGTLSGNLTVQGASGVSLTNVATTNGFLSTRFYIGARGDNQDDVGSDNKWGPWYGLGESGIPDFTGVPCLAGYAGVALRTSTGIFIMKDGGAVGIGTTNVMGRHNIAYLGSADFQTLQNTNYSANQFINQRFMFGKNNASNSSAYVQAALNASDETDLVFYVDGGSGSVTDRFRIRGDGNIVATASVGIGTTTIDTELYVYGKGKFFDATAGVPANGINGGAGTRLILWPGNASACPYALGIDASTLWYGTPATATHKWYQGTTNIMSLNAGGNLILNDRLLNVAGGTPYAVPTGFMAGGSLTIGGIDRNYGGGNNWTTNTAGLLMECLDNTEIGIHDGGTRVASFMYFQGGSTNTFTIGRDMGWGITPLIINSRLQCNSNVGIGTATPNAPLHVVKDADSGANIYVSNPNSGLSAYALVAVINNTGFGCNLFQNSSTRISDGGVNTATLRNDAGRLRLMSNTGTGMSIETGGYATLGGGDSSVMVYGPNATWGAYLRCGAGTNALSANTAQVISTNGNLHLCAGLGKDLYFNFYQNQAGQLGGTYSYGTWNHTGNITAGEYYANGWYRLNNTSTGLYWQNLGRGLWSPDAANNSYGHVSTYNPGRNGWSGYGLADRYCFMKYDYGVQWGIHDNFYSWLIYGDGGFSRSVTIGGGVLRAAREYDRLLIYANGDNTAGGYFYYNQTNAYGVISDQRIKENIQESLVDKSIAFIKGLKAYQFRLKDKNVYKTKLADGTDAECEGTSVCNCLQDGWIAQNVLESAEQAGIPKNVCANWFDYQKELTLPEEERKTLIGVSDRPILCHTVTVVKRLMEEIDVLTQRNKILETWARDQEAKMAKMEANIEKMASLLAQLISKQ